MSEEVNAQKSFTMFSNRFALQEKGEIIHVLTVCVEETQRQYNECFAEAAEQDKLLELHRNAISELQEKVQSMEYRTCTTITLLHTIYYSFLSAVQEQLEARVNDFQVLQSKIDTLVQSKNYLELKYEHEKMSWRQTEEKLQELKNATLQHERKMKIYEDKGCQCIVEVDNKDCLTQSMESKFNDDTMFNAEQQSRSPTHEHELQSEISTLIRENEDMKRQLQKWKLDFDIIDKELKIERKNDAYPQDITAKLERLKSTEYCLRLENEQLKCDLEKQTNEMKEIWKKLRFVQEKSAKFEKVLKKLQDKQTEINSLHNQIICNKAVIRERTETIEQLEKRLDINEHQTKEYLYELNTAEETLSILRDRVRSLKALLKEKSDSMATLEADYEMLKNENSILKAEGSIVENKTKEDIQQLRKQLNEIELQLCLTEDNYQRVTQDFSRTQEQLIKATKREADLQASMTNMEKDYSLKLVSVENEKFRLGDLVEKLTDDLEDIQRKYSSKNMECCKLQNVCKSYVEQVDALRQNIEEEREKVTKIEESNHCFVQQLRECMEQNCILVQEKSFINQNDCKIIEELQEMHRSILELGKDYQLKKKSLACISVDLTQTAMSRSELCNESQYVVSCIRSWMDEQRKHVENLAIKLKSKQQRLLQLGFEKKALLITVRELRRVNNLLTQRLKRVCRPGRGIKNVCGRCYIAPSVSPQNISIRTPLNSNYSRLQKKCFGGPIKTARRTSVCGNPWWFQKMEYLINELRKNNLRCNENPYNRENTDTTLEETRDCGYQSSTSK